MDEIDIKKMYKYQKEEINNEDYQEYLKYLNYILMKDHKKEIYTKEFVNGQYILVDKKTKQKIIITPSEFINLTTLYNELKQKSELILYKISLLIESNKNITDENRQEFELLKNQYMICSTQLNDINTINDSYYSEINELISSKIEKADNIAKYYKKRHDIYAEIKTMISEKIKNKLIKIFKENILYLSLPLSNILEFHRSLIQPSCVDFTKDNKEPITFCPDCKNLFYFKIFLIIKPVLSGNIITKNWLLTVFTTR